MSFQDKVVVITGAASGIGRATAGAFAQRGARVHLVDKDEKVNEAAGALIRPGIPHVADVTDVKAMERLAEEIWAAEGRVDILHNNAGVCLGGPFQELGIEDMRWLIDINLWGVIHGVHAFLPFMLEQGWGHIVNTASMAGIVPFPMVAAYCASKYAVVGFSEALSAELGGRDIHVTVFCPGMVATELFRNARACLPGNGNAMVRRAMDRYGTSADQVASEILEAIEKRKTVAVSGWGMLALQAIHRTSRELYGQLARLMSRWGGKALA